MVDGDKKKKRSKEEKKQRKEEKKLKVRVVALIADLESYLCVNCLDADIIPRLELMSTISANPVPAVSLPQERKMCLNQQQPQFPSFAAPND